MSTIETATGPVDSAELGRVLMHEHVFIISPEMQNNVPEDWGDEQARMDDAARRLQELKASGIDAIVDPTALGSAAASRIALATDRPEDQCRYRLYTFNESHYWAGERLVAVRTVATRWSTSSCETSWKVSWAPASKRRSHQVRIDRPGVTPDVERVPRLRQDAPRRCAHHTHTDAALRRGLSSRRSSIRRRRSTRVVIGHSGDTEDLGYLEELIANGSILGMDRFGIDGFLTTAKRVAVIAELCRRGYADRMVLSHDASCYLDWIPGEIRPSSMPHWHYLHISRDVLPALREAGVTDAQIDTMLIDTPRRFLENAGPY